ncbi:hypothetical protein ACS0TY_028455 [Phlomoides rotata]
MGHPERHSTDQKNEVRGSEVFVGGLPRNISEEKIREVFSACGEIMEVRMIHDQKGAMKGFCFVRFVTKESATRATREISGTLLDGKKIGVLPSTEQDTLYFGNLNKAWGPEEFNRIVLQVFPDIESIDLRMLKDVQPGQKQRNRGFAFVKFSSHAAAARAQRVGSQPDFRLGSLHPAVQWAEEEPEIDPEEHAKIKIAFVRNLPSNAEENYLKQLFEPFGKVEKVVVSKKASSAVGFVHFTERSDLERAIKELNEKTVQGPRGDQIHKLQVEVARPLDRNKKRVRENSETKPSVLDHPKLLKSNIHDFHVQGVLEPVDPYEEAVIALPQAVKERLLRILRLGIASRFDIDVKSLCSLKTLPESIAISVLDQFMLSGATSPNKGAFLAGLISKHLVDKVVPDRSLFRLPEVEDTARNGYKLLNYSHRSSPPPVGSYTSYAPSAARSDIYSPHYPSLLPDYRTLLDRERVDEQGSLLSTRSLSGPQSIGIPRVEERSHSPYEATPPVPSTMYYGRIGLRTEERRASPVQAAPSSSMSYSRLDPTSLSSDKRAVGTHPQASRPQLRFDPFTGEPYNFDPFTGEPIIHPGNTKRQF